MDLKAEASLHNTLPADLIGVVVDGRYRIDSYIDGGGMGEVFRATHLSLVRTVAIKFLRSERINAKREEVLRRFELEARTASKIDHPNAIPIYDYGVYRSRPYLVMKYLEGETLKDILGRNRVLSCKRAAEICIDVCAALDAAHSQRVVHRDLKPANIMLVRRHAGTEGAIVLDFGIAKVLEKPGEPVTTLTSDGVLLGTPLYMSPEQIRGGAVDQRSDIYSLGVILYQTLCGRLPFEGNSAIDVLMGHLNQSPISLRSRRSSIPLELELVILKALEKTPELRQQSIRQFGEAFAAALVPVMPRDTATFVTKLSSRSAKLSLTLPILTRRSFHRWSFRLRAVRCRSFYQLRDWIAASPFMLLAGCGLAFVLIGCLLFARSSFPLLRANARGSAIAEPARPRAYERAKSKAQKDGRSYAARRFSVGDILIPAAAPQSTPVRKLLLLEDDPGTAEIIRTALSHAGYDVTWYEHADDTITFFQPAAYDVAILDVRLPGERDGFDVCRHIRAEDSEIAILFLTVVSDEIDRIVGLELGADDYLVKPFSTRELIARIKTILRRTRDRKPASAAAAVTYGGLSIDFDLRKVERNGSKLELTATEFNLLAFLARNPGRPYTRAQVIQEVWGYDSDGYEDSVTVLIQRLRSALEENPKHPRFIVTVRGIGYRFCEASELALEPVPPTV